MLDSSAILQLYTTVLVEDIRRNRIPEKDIRLGVKDMAQAYAPNATNFESDLTDRKYTNFNIAAFRCAYLHKYAPLHTYIVFDVMTKIVNQEIQLFNSILNSKQFKLCCLGGGPGSDAVGVLAALHTVFRKFNSAVTVIDSMEEWKYTFGLVISYLQIAGIKLQWNYIGADLLQIKSMKSRISNAINSASLITMVKFISAATCNNTELMVEKIFRVVRPGALVLYIDNAAGGFTEVIERASAKMNLEVIAGPYKHMEYSNEDLRIERFGYTSCFHTKVTIVLLKKLANNQNKTLSPSNSYYSSQCTSASKRKVLLQDVQNTKEVPTKIRVTTSSNRNKTQSTAQPRCYNENISTSTIKASSRDVQNINEVSSGIRVLTQTFFPKETQSLPQHNCANQNVSVSKVKAPLRDVQNINEVSSGIRVLTQTFFPKETQNLLQPNCDNQIVSVSKVKAPLRDVQNTDEVPSEIRVLTQTFFPKTTQSLPQPNCANQTVSVSKVKAPLRDVQNTDEVPSGIRVLTPTFLRKNVQNPSQPNCPNQSISASKREALVQDGQNTNVPSGTGVLTPTFLCKKIQSSTQPNCVSQNISASERKDTLSNMQNTNDALSKICAAAQEKISKSVLSNNSAITSCSKPTNNENAGRSFSNTHAVKINNVNRQNVRYQPQAADSPSSFPVSVVDTQTFLTPKKQGSKENNNYNAYDSEYDIDNDYSNDACCSCCVIS